MHEEVQKVVLLFSGGLDSTVALAMALDEGNEVFPVSFYYGQRNQLREQKAAQNVVDFYRRKGMVVHPTRWVGILGLPSTSALTDPDLPLEKGSVAVGSAYVPARNMIMLALAGSMAESLGCSEIWHGLLRADVQLGETPDSSPEFVEAVERALHYGTKVGTIDIRSPLLRCNKAQAIAEGLARNAPINLSWSCFDTGPQPCGTCAACITRSIGFTELGIADPALFDLLLAGKKFV